MDQKRACYTFIVFTCRWKAECSGCGVIHYWPTKWMCTMSVWEVWQPSWTAWFAPRWRDSTSHNLPA